MSEARLRLQHFLAQAGVASRRKAEELILAGRVAVNGKAVTELGTKVDPTADRVTVDRERVLPEAHAWIVLNKPRGVMCTTRDPEGRTTVMDLLGETGSRLYPVGRLDYLTEGALLVTNDGALAEALMHPRNRIPRVYHVKVHGLISVEALEQLRKGVPLETGETVASEVFILTTTGQHSWLEMTIRQGLNHQIHRMIEAVGTRVLKLIRVAFGPLTVEGLPPGRFRPLVQAEVDELRKAVGLKRETVRPPAASAERYRRRPQPQEGRAREGDRAATGLRRRDASRQRQPLPRSLTDEKKPPQERPARQTAARRAAPADAKRGAALPKAAERPRSKATAGPGGHKPRKPTGKAPRARRPPRRD
ncbi:MAG: rRNA pseudouridine synthase [Deltaproteobacteria bacterium]|nr:rRNA pseudouridine synthase [Deltaproteobacteria bacterium]